MSTSTLQVYGFYKGMSMPITTVSVSSSVVFGTYRNVLQILRQLRGKTAEAPSAKLDIFLSGLAGGVAQVSHTHFIILSASRQSEKWKNSVYTMSTDLHD